MDMVEVRGEDLFQEGVRLFNKGYYFQAHEVWEDLWRSIHSPERKFLQGLIQIAAGFHKWHQQKKLNGARSLLRKGTHNVSLFLSHPAVRPFHNFHACILEVLQRMEDNSGNRMASAHTEMKGTPERAPDPIKDFWEPQSVLLPESIKFPF